MLLWNSISIPKQCKYIIRQKMRHQAVVKKKKGLLFSVFIALKILEPTSVEWSGPLSCFWRPSPSFVYHQCWICEFNTAKDWLLFITLPLKQTLMWHWKIPPVLFIQFLVPGRLHKSRGIESFLAFWCPDLKCLFPVSSTGGRIYPLVFVGLCASVVFHHGVTSWCFEVIDRLLCVSLILRLHLPFSSLVTSHLRGFVFFFVHLVSLLCLVPRSSGFSLCV